MCVCVFVINQNVNTISILHRLHFLKPGQKRTTRTRDDGEGGSGVTPRRRRRHRLRRLCFCRFMRRWMETQVVLHRRRERRNATGCVRSLERLLG